MSIPYTSLSQPVKKALTNAILRAQKLSRAQGQISESLTKRIKDLAGVNSIEVLESVNENLLKYEAVLPHIRGLGWVNAEQHMLNALIAAITEDAIKMIPQEEVKKLHRIWTQESNSFRRF